MVPLHVISLMVNVPVRLDSEDGLAVIVQMVSGGIPTWHAEVNYTYNLVISNEWKGHHR